MMAQEQNPLDDPRIFALYLKACREDFMIYHLQRQYDQIIQRSPFAFIRDQKEEEQLRIITAAIAYRGVMIAEHFKTIYRNARG